jgi:hypothetical protein
MTEPTPDIPAEQAFALLLETACEDFEVLQHLIAGQIRVVAPEPNESFPGDRHDHLIALRARRAPAAIRTALAKSFIFNARRANRICTLNKATLDLSRVERTRFLKTTAPLIAVRDVNEHGYDGDGSVRPSMHIHEGAILDETSLVIHGPEEILIGPLNLHNRMRTLAGFSALYAKDGKNGIPLGRATPIFGH